MKRMQIYLEESTSKAIRSMALESGKKQSEIIREALAEYITKHKGHYSTAALGRAKGLWEKRQDFPGLDQLRSEWERDHKDGQV